VYRRLIDDRGRHTAPLDTAGPRLL
jgi:hypothetical protein